MAIGINNSVGNLLTAVLPHIIARSAFSIRAAHQIQMLVRNENNCFCRKDLRAASLLLSTDSLTLWFSRFQNRIARNEVKEWYRPVQGPFSDPNLMTFFKMTLFTKRWTLIDPSIPVGYGAFWVFVSIWRNLTCDHCFEHLVKSTHGWTECFAPLPCTVYLV